MLSQKYIFNRTRSLNLLAGCPKILRAEQEKAKLQRKIMFRSKIGPPAKNDKEKKDLEKKTFFL